MFFILTEKFFFFFYSYLAKFHVLSFVWVVVWLSFCNTCSWAVAVERNESGEQVCSTDPIGRYRLISFSRKRYFDWAPLRFIAYRKSKISLRLLRKMLIFSICGARS